MWKYIAVFAVIFGLAVYVARQDERAVQRGAQNAAHLNNSAVAVKTDEDHPEKSTGDAERDTPSWYGFFRWPNGTTTWAIILTLLAIAEQTKQTAKAADAAEKNAEALVKSERAWLTAKVENFDEPAANSKMIWIEVPITNHGRTPARVQKIVATSKVIPVPKNSLGGRPGELPKTPDYTDGNKLNVLAERDIIIAPSDTLRHVHVFIWPDDWEKIKARELSLYVYGYIEYFDTVKGKEHRTGFCSIYWVPEVGFNEPTGFMFSQVLPAAYFSAT